MSRYIIDFNNGKKFEAELSIEYSGKLYIPELDIHATVEMFKAMGATILKKKEPLRIEARVIWNKSDVVYPTGSFMKINTDWSLLAGKKGKLAFVEDEE